MGDHDICPSCGGASLKAALLGCQEPKRNHAVTYSLWSEGDIAIVTGDKGEHHHHFPEGTRVELVRKNDTREPVKQSWRCRALTFMNDNKNPPALAEWNVWTTDLEPLIEDEDVQAAIDSIMGNQ